MISNLATQNSVTKEKRRVLEQCYSIIPKEKIKTSDLSLCGVEENIALWNLRTSDMSFYFYTNLQGKVLFDGICFPYASNFSDGCAWVKDFSDVWFIINLFKKEIVEMPVVEMSWKNIRDIRHGNLAMLNNKNQWGSYFYNQEENTFQEDIPFIWDALEFSREVNLVYAGVYSSREFVNSLNEWRPENIQMQIKISKMPKDAIYDLKAYRNFLQQYFLNPNIGIDISIYEESVSLSKKQKIQKDFISYAHNIADDYFDEKNESLLNTNTNTNIQTGSLEDYTRVRGRVLK